MDERKTITPVGILLIGVKLLVICAAVAAVVAGVYFLTKDRSEENIREQKKKAIEEIFVGQTVEYSDQAVEDCTLYTVTANGSTVGYCVEIASPGFGGDVSLMVGYLSDGTVKSVRVISHSETPGLGSVVCEEAYLEQYGGGLSGVLTLGEDVDAKVGATVTSKAVLAGVNRATELLQGVLTGGAK